MSSCTRIRLKGRCWKHVLHFGPYLFSMSKTFGHTLSKRKKKKEGRGGGVRVTASATALKH